MYVRSITNFRRLLIKNGENVPDMLEFYSYLDQLVAEKKLKMQNGWVIFNIPLVITREIKIF